MANFISAYWAMLRGSYKYQFILNKLEKVEEHYQKQQLALMRSSYF
jgi:hypothetical protein